MWGKEKKGNELALNADSMSCARDWNVLVGERACSGPVLASISAEMCDLMC